MNPIFVGVIVNSALYFSAVLVGALFSHNWFAARLDIAAIGITYFSYLVQTLPVPRLVMMVVVGVSVVAGVAAGLALL